VHLGAMFPMLFPVDAPLPINLWIQWTSFLHAFFLVVVLVGVFTWRLPQVFQGKVVNPFKEDKKSHPAVWVINGKRYDLTGFMKHHPGGDFALKLCQGSDCTGLFETYHVFVDKAKQAAIMRKYELPESDDRGKDIVQRPVEDTGMFGCPFHEDLKKMCREHFAGKPKNSHKCKTSYMVFHACVQVMLFAALYRVFRYHEWAPCIVVALCAWHLTGNVAHEASHFTYAANRMVNRIGSMAGFPFSFNSAGWHLQHVVQHHIYTNDESDIDLYHFVPLMRVSKAIKLQSLMRAQQYIFYLVLLPTAITHLYFVVPFDILWGTTDPATNEKRYEQALNLERFRKNVFWQMFGEVSLFPIYLAAVLWAKGGGFMDIFPLWCFIASMCSLQFLFCTQVSHLQAETFAEKPDKSWAKRQIGAAYDYNQDSLFWAMATGSLNMQAIHHVLPCVSASHYHDMYPKFREVCKKHDVTILEHSSATACALGFASWIAELSHEA